MARDRKGIPISEVEFFIFFLLFFNLLIQHCIHLIAQLLKQDHQYEKTDDEFRKHLILVYLFIL